MPRTLRELMAEPAFGLRGVPGVGLEEVLDREIAWVHSSDLPDPTPWLEPGQLLLTNGLQLAGPHLADARAAAASARAYVRRLVAADVLALGFATRVVHEVVPAPLVAACAAEGLALVEVVDRAPFIALIREVADAAAADRSAALEEALAAHRAVARAALRPDGLAAVLGALERHLGCWVALFDGSGAEVAVRTGRGVAVAAEHDVAAGVRALLSRGRGSLVLDAGGAPVTLQTLGTGPRPSGVLAVGTAAPLDTSSADLVASVIALASIAVEQSRTLVHARTVVRASLLRLVLAGALPHAGPAAADGSASEVAVPHAPLRLAVLVPTGRTPTPVAAEQPGLLEDLAVHPRLRDCLAAQDDGCVVVLLPAADAEELADTAARRGHRSGLSGPGGWDQVAELLAQARRAAALTGPDRPVVRFDDLAAAGVLGALHAAGGEELARATLAPLAGHPQGDVLLVTLRAWTAHGCQADPAARALGVHRQTVAARVRLAGGLLGLDLADFADQAQLWALLALAPEDGGGPPGGAR